MADKKVHIIQVTEEQWLTIDALFRHYDWDLEELTLEQANALKSTSEIPDEQIQESHHDTAQQAEQQADQQGDQQTDQHQQSNQQQLNQQLEYQQQTPTHHVQHQMPQPEAATAMDNGADECHHCYCRPCITTYRQRWLGNGNPPRPGNNTLRRKKYKLFWRMMSNRYAWSDPRYLQKKATALGQANIEENGNYNPEIREIMPDCILELVRSLYPNPSKIPYMGHKWI